LIFIQHRPTRLLRVLDGESLDRSAFDRDYRLDTGFSLDDFDVLLDGRGQDLGDGGDVFSLGKDDNVILLNDEALDNELLQQLGWFVPGDDGALLAA
jgi:hypothetical protein